MKLLFIVNATASSVTARTRVVIQKALSSEHKVTVAETTRRGHASRLARQAVTDGLDGVVVLGGDGTLNEAANGLAGSNVKLGVLPGGSTNVFARNIGMTNDPIEATAELLDAMHEDNVKRIGLGSVDGRYFMFHTGIGFDAAVVGQVERRSYLKRYAGHPWFTYATLRTGLSGYDRKNPTITVHFPDGKTVDHVFQVLVLNSNPYTYLGSRPINIAPEATLEAPLVVICITSFEAWRVAKLFGFGAFTNRGVRGMRGISYHPDVVDCVLESSVPVPYQVDGDYLGTIDHLNFRHEPASLSLYVPLAN